MTPPPAPLFLFPSSSLTHTWYTTLLCCGIGGMRDAHTVHGVPQTGKGRTACVLACFLAWVGERDFETPMQALQFISDLKMMDMSTLTIPSQRRYLQYFTNVMDGVKPRSEPLVLRRMIINTIPNFTSQPAKGARAGEGGQPGTEMQRSSRPRFRTQRRPRSSSSSLRSASHPPRAKAERCLPYPPMSSSAPSPLSNTLAPQVLASASASSHSAAARGG